MHKLLPFETSLAQPNERRKSVRYRIAGTAWYEWQATDGRRFEETGVTRDIGSAGAYIECDSMPPVGSIVKLVVTFRSRWQEDITVCLRGAGDVRHVRQTEGFGASVVFRTATANSQKPARDWQ
jgi:hypothetical protein